MTACAVLPHDIGYIPLVSDSHGINAWTLGGGLRFIFFALEESEDKQAQSEYGSGVPRHDCNINAFRL